MIAIEYTRAAIELREAINIALSIFTLVLCGLLTWFIASEFKKNGYPASNWTAKLSIGLLFIFFGEFLRSATIWWILHTEGAGGTYLNDIPMLIASLGCIVLGCLCAIRVMTPKEWGNVLWIGSLAIVAFIFFLNWSYLL